MSYIISSWHFVLAVRCPISYHHETLCPVVYVKAKGFMPTRHWNHFWHFMSARSLFVCSRRVLPFKPCDGAALCCTRSVCAPANEWSSIQSEQTSSEWINKFELTKHAVISHSVACDGILKSHQEFCASVLVIVDRSDGEAWSHLHGIRSCDMSDTRFFRMKRTHPAVARGRSVVMDGVLVSSCDYIATNSTRVQ